LRSVSTRLTVSPGSPTSSPSPPGLASVTAAPSCSSSGGTSSAAVAVVAEALVVRAL
jgi:hypothetical protein